MAIFWQKPRKKAKKLSIFEKKKSKNCHGPFSGSTSKWQRKMGNDNFLIFFLSKIDNFFAFFSVFWSKNCHFSMNKIVLKFSGSTRKWKKENGPWQFFLFFISKIDHFFCIFLCFFCQNIAIFKWIKIKLSLPSLASSRVWAKGLAKI